MDRAGLAALISGAHGEAAGAAGSPAQILALATGEGVVALASARLATLPIDRQLSGLTQAARQAATRSLLFESETRRVLAHLFDAGLPTLLLKGSALAYWLYPSPHLRECADIDLLLPSQAAAEQAARLLQTLGYERRERSLSGDLTTYELTCVRRVAGLPVEVDVHWGIGGAPVFAARLGVEELFAAALPLPQLSQQARGLAPVHAFLHAAMHRLLNLHLVGDRLKWLYDIHLLAAHFSDAEWRHLVTLAAERGLADTSLAALQASCDTLGTHVPAQIHAELTAVASAEPLQAARMTEWRYIQWQNLKALHGWPTRLRWLRQRLLPSAGYLRDRYGHGRGTRHSWWRYLRHGLGKLRA